MELFSIRIQRTFQLVSTYRGGTGAGRRPFPFARTLTNGNGRKEVFFLFFRSFNHGGAKPNIKWYKKIYHFWLFSLLMI